MSGSEGNADNVANESDGEQVEPATGGEQHRAAGEAEEGMRTGIRSWVTRPGRWLRPIGSVALIASLTASALAPGVAAAVVHGGQVGGLWGAVWNQLGQLGCGYLSSQLITAVERLRGRDGMSEETIRQVLAAEFEQGLAGSDAALLRDEMSRLIRSVEGVQTAVTAAVRSGDEQVSAHLVSGIRQVAESFAEFRPLLDDTSSALSRLEQSVAEQRHSLQLNLVISERILVEVGLTRRELSQTWRHAPGATASGGEQPPVVRDIANNPYLGLEPFRGSDADRFFGRAALTERLRARLSERARGVGVLLVIGPSGSGKSSLLRAGLIPSTQAGLPGVPGSEDWPQLMCMANADPLDDIITWLSSRPHGPERVRREDIGRDPGRLAEALRAAVPNPDHRVLIVVDQFEQMFAAHRDPWERTRLIRALRAAADPATAGASGPAALVVLGVRADFYAHCLSDQVLATLLPDAQFPVPAMTEGQLREVICRPARMAGVEVEPSLVERIMRDLGLRAGPDQDPMALVDRAVWLLRGAHQGAVLPLLSHALRETWTAGTGAVMTVEDYENTGGLYGAVAATASDVFRRLDRSGQETAQDVLLRLVSIGSDVPDTRRSRTLGELLRGRDEPGRTQVREVIERLTASRLLTVDTAMDPALPRQVQVSAVSAPAGGTDGSLDPVDNQRVEISHDALLYAWPRLARWLNEDRKSLLVRQQLADAAQSWDRDRDDHGLLLRTSRLADAALAANRNPGDLSPLEQEYLRASMAAAEAEIAAQRSRQRFKRRMNVAFSLTTVLAVTVAVVAVIAGLRINQQNRELTSQRLAAQAHEVRDANPRASALLALAAWDTSRTPEARGAVLSLQNNPLTDVAADEEARTLTSNDAGDVFTTLDRSGILVLRHGKQERTLPSRVGPIHRVAFGANNILAAAGENGIEIWTDPTKDHAGRVVSTKPATREAHVTGLAFGGKNRSTLYAANANRTIQRWRVADGKPAGRPIKVGQPVMAIAGQHCDDDSVDETCRFATADVTGEIRLRDADTGSPVEGRVEPDLTKDGLRAYDLAFSPDGDSLAIASDDQRVHLWAVSENKEVGNIDAHSLPVHQLVFAAEKTCVSGGTNSCLLVTVSFDAVRVWNVRRGGPGATTHLVAKLESQGSVPTDATFVNDARDLVLAYNDGSLAMWDIDRITFDGAVNDLAFDPEENANAGMAIAGGRGYIDLLPAEPRSSGSISVRQGNRARNYVSIAYGPDGRRWAAAGDARNVYVSENSYRRSALSTNGSPLFDASDKEVTQAVFGIDNDTLYTGDDDGRVKKWLIGVKGASTEARQLKELTADDQNAGGRNSTVMDMAISADRSVLAVAFADGTVRLWGTATDEPSLAPVTASGTSVMAVAFSPDYSTFFTGDAHGVIRRWDTVTGKQIGDAVTGHSGPVASLAASPDGVTLASGSHDHSVKLWRIEPDRAPVIFGNLVGHTDKVNVVAFQPESGLLLSGSDDRSILRWNLDFAVAIATACLASEADIEQEAWKRIVPGLSFDEYRHMCDKYRTSPPPG